MDVTKRRMEILKILSKRRYETAENLAAEFDVSIKTIRRDINYLSQYEPLYTMPGRYNGGIYMMDNYYADKMYFSNKEYQIFIKILSGVKNNSPPGLSDEEINILEQMLKKYTKPNIKNKEGAANE